MTTSNSRAKFSQTPQSGYPYPYTCIPAHGFLLCPRNSTTIQVHSTCTQATAEDVTPQWSLINAERHPLPQPTHTAASARDQTYSATPTFCITQRLGPQKNSTRSPGTAPSSQPRRKLPGSFPHHAITRLWAMNERATR
jgi:hypothetical protein